MGLINSARHAASVCVAFIMINGKLCLKILDFDVDSFFVLMIMINTPWPPSSMAYSINTALLSHETLLQ